MYSVPFDYNWYSNWFDVWLYSGKRRANYNLWYQMYYDNPESMRGVGVRWHVL